jgi:hypothetical protein
MSRIRTKMSRIRNTGKRCYQIRNGIKIGPDPKRLLLETLRPVFFCSRPLRKFFSIRVVTFFSYILFLDGGPRTTSSSWACSRWRRDSCWAASPPPMMSTRWDQLIQFFSVLLCGTTGCLLVPGPVFLRLFLDKKIEKIYRRKVFASK